MHLKYYNILKKYHEEDYFPSAVLTAFNKKEELFTCSIGNADRDSIFDAGTLTKIVTSTIIMYLVKSGKLSLYDNVKYFMPFLKESPFLANRLKEVSVFSMLTHTSTLPPWTPLYALEGSFAQRLETALKQEKVYKGMVYGDINFMLLGKIIENVLNAPLDEVVSKNFVGYHGLGNLFFKPKDKTKVMPSSYGNEIEQNLCNTLGIKFDGFRPKAPIQGDAYDGNTHYYFNGVAGHAGIFADVHALRRLCQMYMYKRSPFLISALQNKGMNRGFGFQHSDHYPSGCGHTSLIGSALWISKSRKIGAVILTNRMFYENFKYKGMWGFREEIFNSLADEFDK
ncbi:MAG: beta-lactamase family protein [Christensenellaceae bacterium]|nr:beta-lactamase family protein [Christensenellaceae bacterium]